jgi:hypothetical protein
MHSRRLANSGSVAALAALTAVLVAACGGGTRPPTGTNSGSDGGAARSLKAAAVDAYKQSACMRRHGVKNFPDPTVVSNSHQQMIGIHVTPAITGSPSFKSAQRACAHLMPQGNQTLNSAAAQHQQQEHTAGLLAFAACMRSHGFKRFPDPDSQGNLTPAMLQSANINLQAPALKPAADACTAVTHGQISKADIDQAIANPQGGGG